MSTAKYEPEPATAPESRPMNSANGAAEQSAAAETEKSVPERKTIKFVTPWMSETHSPGGPPLAFSDTGNARRLVLSSVEDVRYCHEFRQWLIWQDRRWVKDSTGEIVRCAKKAVRGILLEAAAETQDERRREMLAWQRKSESDHSIRSMVRLAESEEGIPVRVEELDADPWVLNVLNGTLDLRTGELRAHHREDLLTKVCPVEYVPEAKCPLFTEFMQQINAGNSSLVQYLRRAAGYSLTGLTNEHALFLLYGIGANGKSTFLEAMRFLLGDYAAMADFGSFMVTRGGSIRNDLARLRGARFVTATESGDGKHLDEAVVKHLTGGDTVAARFLYSEHFEFRPQFKLWLATNHRPTIKGTDTGIWRRIKLLPFGTSIAPERQDRNLPEKLKAEAPGILRWALDGLAEWRTSGLGEPEEVRSATSQYRASQDVLQQFIEDRCSVAVHAAAKASSLYEEYGRWCKCTGERQMTQREFGIALSERGFQRTKKHEGRGWAGLGLLAD